MRCWEGMHSKKTYQSPNSSTGQETHQPDLSFVHLSGDKQVHTVWKNTSESSTGRYSGNPGNHMGLQELKEKKPKESFPQISYNCKRKVICCMFSKGPAWEGANCLCSSSVLRATWFSSTLYCRTCWRTGTGLSTPPILCLELQLSPCPLAAFSLGCLLVQSS